MAIDTPAKLGIIGAGPAGLETALYARFLGYDVILFERGEPAERLRAADDRPLDIFANLSSPLGRAALAAQEPDRPLPALTASLSAKTWRESYLLPLAQSDLISDWLRLGHTVTRVEKEHLVGSEVLGFERGGYDFIVTCRDHAGQEHRETVDALIDAGGRDEIGGVWRADFGFAEPLLLNLDPVTGLPIPETSYGDKLPDEVQLTESSRKLVLHEPNYYVIGDKSARETVSFTATLTQIRDLFTILGDRPTLDLYATAVTLPQ